MYTWYEVGNIILIIMKIYCHINGILIAFLTFFIGLCIFPRKMNLMTPFETITIGAFEMWTLYITTVNCFAPTGVKKGAFNILTLFKLLFLQYTLKDFL